MASDMIFSIVFEMESVAIVQASRREKRRGRRGGYVIAFRMKSGLRALMLLATCIALHSTISLERLQGAKSGSYLPPSSFSSRLVGILFHLLI